MVWSVKLFQMMNCRLRSVKTQTQYLFLLSHFTTLVFDSWVQIYYFGLYHVTFYTGSKCFSVYAVVKIALSVFDCV